MAERDEDIEELFSEYMGKGKGKRKKVGDRPPPERKDEDIIGGPGHLARMGERRKKPTVGIPRRREREPDERRTAMVEEEREPIWKRLGGSVGQSKSRSDTIKSARPRLCPTCSAPLSDRNKVRACNVCGEVSCEMCGDYERNHLASHIHYDYEFDFPLCLRCYEKAFTIQKELGKAVACFGAGNYTDAERHARNAMGIGQGSRYAERAERLLEKAIEAKKSYRAGVNLRKTTE